jgi:hypothetical protein
MVKRIYNMKKTISMRQFIAELGEDFSEHVKKRLMDLSQRCVLTRKEEQHRLDLKHVEHIQHECAVDLEGSANPSKKEYSYGQFVVSEGNLYFSQKCAETQLVMQAPIVASIYDSLKNGEIINESDIYSKKIDDNNIDYIVDNILAVCPEVSQSHLDIVRGMTDRSVR